jgi:hypothetical protein
LKITETETWQQDGKPYRRTLSNVTFEKGEGILSLTTGPDGKVVGFDLKSEKITDWLQKPEDLTVYQNGCEHFISAFLEGKIDETFAMMHDSLQAEVPRDKLEEMIEKVRAANGPLREIKAAGDEWAAGEGMPSLILRFDLQCENRAATCEMTIRFIGMQGHITGFRFQ